MTSTPELFSLHTGTEGVSRIELSLDFGESDIAALIKAHNAIELALTIDPELRITA